MQVSISMAQIARIQRAVTESFVFRMVQVNGEAVVRVASESGNEYTVRAGGRCDCKDKEFNPHTACKHAVASSLWLQGADLPPSTVPSPEEQQARLAAARARRDRDFPEV